MTARDLTRMHPHRLEFVYKDRPIYYVTFCTENRAKLLANSTAHETFKEFAEAAERYGIAVGRYVLMPDHIHVFAAFGLESMSLSTWVKSLKNRLSRALRTQGIPAPHFQKGFFDHVMRHAESYWEKSEYIFLNPVRAGLVERPEDWKFQGEICRLENPVEE